MFCLERIKKKKSFNEDSEPGTVSLDCRKDRLGKAFQTLREDVLKSMSMSSN